MKKSRQPQITKIQSPASKQYSMTAIPKTIENVLEIEKGDHAVWLPIPMSYGEEFEDLIIFTIVDNPHDAQDKVNEILKLLKE